jgi:hypothetical protein
MNNSSTRLLALGLIALLGCGEKLPAPNTLATATHGGQAFRFPDHSGSVEIGSEPAEASMIGVSKQNSHIIFAYFTQADGLTPLASKPTDVKIIQGSLPPIELKHSIQADKAGRFASPPGPRPQDLRGIVEATIDDRKVEIPFNIR